MSSMSIEEKASERYKQIRFAQSLPVPTIHWNFPVGDCLFCATQEDINGETCLWFCSHKDNKCDTEGNCSKELCPFIK